MKFSKKSKYGLTALVDLAANSGNGHVALNCIAERNAISPQYLEQVFAALRRAGIVRSIKGPQGGYLLNDEPENITVAAVLQALDGSYYIEDVRVREGEPGFEISDAIQDLVIDRINAKMDEVLLHLTLADLEEEYQKNLGAGMLMYYI